MAEDIFYNTEKPDEPLNVSPITGITDQQKSVLQLLSPYIVGKSIQMLPNGDVVIGSQSDTTKQVFYDASADTLTVPVVTPNVANRGWVVTNVFSVTDADTVAWGAGSFISSDGTTYSIGAGNTGNMAAKTYIYLDTAVSTTAYQTTTTATTAVGAGKVLIAIAKNGTGEATYFVLNNDDKNIDAANIVANSITANELSTSITYAGSIVIDTAGNIRSGQTAYNTGVGWWIGNDGGTPKLSIGDSTGDNLTYDGSTISGTAPFKTISKITAGEVLVVGQAVFLAGSTTEDIEFSYQNSTDGNTVFGETSSLQKSAQDFTIISGSGTFTLKSIKITINKVGTPTDDAKVAIQADSSGSPSGTDLASVTIDANTGYGALTFNVSLSAGTKYWVVLSRTGALDDTNRYNVARHNSGGTVQPTSGVTWGANFKQYNGTTWSATANGRFKMALILTTTEGRVYAASSEVATRANGFIGFVTANTNINATANIQITGSNTSQSGLSIATNYYLQDYSDTSTNARGRIGSSAGTVSKKVGFALKATELLPNYTT